VNQPLPGMRRPQMPAKASEKDYQDVVVGMAVKILHWESHHVYPLTDSRGNWRTPTSGTMAKGFPDWIFIREDWQVAVEFKGFSADGKPTPTQPGQERCLDLLARGPQHRAWMLRPTDDWDLTVSWFRHPWTAPRTYGYESALGRNLDVRL